MRSSSTFTLAPDDLVRLVESPKAQCAEHLSRWNSLAGLATALKTNVQLGLDGRDARDLQAREQVFGANYIAPPACKGILELMWDAVQDLTIVVLSGAGVVEIILSQTVSEHPGTAWIEGACILLAVLVVTLVTAVNDYQKEQQFRALNAIKEDEQVKVVRNGVPCEISKWSVVVGDVVRVEVGDIICADGVLFDEHDLKLDESAMTGESDLVRKNGDNPFLLSGTKVMEGMGKMLVVCVGQHSQAGIIKNLIHGRKSAKPDQEPAESDHERPRRSSEPPRAGYVEVGTPTLAHTDDHAGDDDDDEPSSPLEIKLNNLTVLIGKLGSLVAVVVFAAMSIRFSIQTFAVDKQSWGSHYLEQYLRFFTTAITVLVVAIPEGLPLAVTISLAYSVKKMLADKNLVRHLDACETMGSATTVCSDKTGTLTTNRMTVMELWLGGTEFSSATAFLNNVHPSSKDILYGGVCLGSTAEILPSKVPGGQPEHTGSKTECALLQFTSDCGVDYRVQRANAKIAHVVTFSSEKKRMSVVLQLSPTRTRIFTKGATEVVLGLCTRQLRPDGTTAVLTAADHQRIGATVIDTYASKGLRTLCLSYRDVECPAEDVATWSDARIEAELTCIAVVGIEDPVRREVPEAIRQCHRAGIVVRMVTGDNIATARSIATKCGIVRPGDGALVMEGHDFRTRVLDSSGNLDQAEFDKLWPMLRVLARSSPKDKYTLVSGLMQTSLVPHGAQIVAVTGDGTNDAPALKKANVGFAMGISGTAVAKDASDIILMDDNFTSIVSAIKWGRNVYDSISKFLQFQLTVNTVAVLLALLGAVFLEQSPLTAVQMLWVNLIMDSFASLALATEAPTDALLSRKPYPKTQPLISPTMTKHIVGQSLMQMTILLVLVFAGDSIFGIDSGRYRDIVHREADPNKPTQHMTLVFNVFVWMQLFNELNCRKIHDETSIFIGITTNPVYIYVCVFQAVLQVIIIELTGDFFGCAPLSGGQWVASLVLGALALPLGLLLRKVDTSVVLPCKVMAIEDGVHQRPLGCAGSSKRGLELWVRGLACVRVQIRVIRAFRRGVEQRKLLKAS